MYTYIKTHNPNNQFDDYDVELTYAHHDASVSDLFNMWMAFMKANGFYGVVKEVKGILHDITHVGTD